MDSRNCPYRKWIIAILAVNELTLLCQIALLLLKGRW